AAVVSPATAGSPPQLLENVVTDAAGDTWIFGTTDKVVFGPKATQDLEVTGRWVAFRPAGGTFTTAPLPRGILLASNVAVSPTGQIVRAWSTASGDTGLATANRSATFAMLPVQRFDTDDVGIDAAGTITLAGTPRFRSPGAGRWVETRTGAAG